MDQQPQADEQPIPAELLKQSFQTAFEVLVELVHEIGDPPHIVKKLNALMLAVAGQ